MFPLVTPYNARRLLVLQIIAVWFSLLAYSWIRTPIPAINEPHYLTKARHFVDPDWCDRDMFITSQDAHVVFFQGIGPLAKQSLLAAAIVGRLVGYLVLAIGWVLLTNRLLSDPWGGVVSVWLFLCITTIGNFSGEWVVGGIESKIPAYGFMFVSLASLLSRRWIVAGCLAGLAVALHPVVGAWNLIALCLLMASTRIFANIRLSVRPIIQFAISCLVCSLPGLMPAIRLVAVTSRNSKQADYIQVFGRLKHHLDPMDFSLFSWLMYTVLGIAFVLLWRKQSENQRFRLLKNYVFATAIIALVGLLVGLGARPATQMPFYEFRGALLKFYPFRLFDVALPIGLSFLLVEFFRTSRETRWRVKHRLAGCVAVGFAITLILPFQDRYPGRLSYSKRNDWIEACDWIQNETPANALVMTPTRNFAFKWYAERAEFVCYKDCPQDADGIVEWNARLNQVRSWASEQYGDKQYSADDLRILATEHGMTHVLAGHLGPMSIAPVFENKSFRVYEIPD
jgi:hypothetical protein